MAASNARCARCHKVTAHGGQSCNGVPCGTFWWCGQHDLHADAPAATACSSAPPTPSPGYAFLPFGTEEAIYDGLKTDVTNDPENVSNIFPPYVVPEGNAPLAPLADYEDAVGAALRAAVFVANKDLQAPDGHTIGKFVVHRSAPLYAPLRTTELEGAGFTGTATFLVSFVENQNLTESVFPADAEAGLNDICRQRLLLVQVVLPGEEEKRETKLSFAASLFTMGQMNLVNDRLRAFCVEKSSSERESMQAAGVLQAVSAVADAAESRRRPDAPSFEAFAPRGNGCIYREYGHGVLTSLYGARVGFVQHDTGNASVHLREEADDMASVYDQICWYPKFPLAMLVAFRRFCNILRDHAKSINATVAPPAAAFPPKPEPAPVVEVEEESDMGSEEE